MDEIKYRNALGESIRRIRKNRNLTQDSFSEKIGIEPSSLSNIENGKSFPSTLTLIQIQRQFNVSPNEIFDVDHLQGIVQIEEEIFSTVKSFDTERKRTVYKIIKALEY